MKRIALKLAIALALIPGSLLLVGVTQNGFFFLVFLASIPFAILYWIDLGAALRSSPSRSLLVRIPAVLFGVPQALFGLTSFLIGIAIVIWVLYNTFIERQPEFSGGLLSLGIGPALMLFGGGWIFTAFGRTNSDGQDSEGA